MCGFGDKDRRPIDPPPVSGIYFIFQDISVRTEGTFSLRFSFCDLKELLIRSSLNGYPNSRGSVGAEVFSESFRVYSAKKFPGMTDIDRSASDRVKRIQHIASTFVLQQNWVEELDNDPVF
ncbi:7489_t:CDS:2 [Entrophospora sp. SA101]|nr:7489_t:CDS:2 [Entrophospora sp. SA101]